ncbi:excinuclease ABC, C subunit [Methanosalsum zhilinae DSM 4017]|uniref:UvrABC system protein C n=1 Tax=Methanosalsum zhilinae (strain DSM 4017 / NBRC 107636 / OCM 62 / WeN5) TaxID=679901 RepID=F7XQC1_METZD|nr:excinuclease ABC, C subunit [Methanosalsum zhilinae DSM 4017]
MNSLFSEISDRIPDEPGVYLMKDSSGDVIYVGKALSLKKRVRQYFQSQKNHHPRTRVLVKNIADVDYIVTGTEIDALILEANLIKKHRPRYNVRLKDDKRYPYVKITTNSRYPRIFLTRKRLDDGALYFGPYTNVTPVRKTLDILARIFGIRRCKKKIGADNRYTRPCLNFHIKQCLAPCSGEIVEEEYQEMVGEVVKLFQGDSSSLIHRLEERMNQFSSEMKYESAAMIRDQIITVEEISNQQITTSGWDDRDVIAGISEAGNIYVQLFYVREGNIVGKADFSLAGLENEEFSGEVLAEFIKQYYQDSPVPSEILVPLHIPEKELIQKWLSGKGRKDVRIHVPVKGDKKKLLEMAEKNALMFGRQARQGADSGQYIRQALEELKSVLSLPSPPYHIEGIDISNISGTDAVGSVVVFEDGNPLNGKYRQYNIRSVQGPDDFSMIAEVVKRRYSGIVEKSGNLPDLVLIDGGAGQVQAACRSLNEIGVDIQVIGLAKKFETIVLPDSSKTVNLPSTSSARTLLMRIRDEAHRFALSAHRRKRAAKLTHSRLDSIPGIGKNRKRALLQEFRSVDRIERSSVEELARIPGISRKLAEQILAYLKN